MRKAKADRIGAVWDTGQVLIDRGNRVSSTLLPKQSIYRMNDYEHRNAH